MLSTAKQLPHPPWDARFWHSRDASKSELECNALARIINTIHQSTKLSLPEKVVTAIQNTALFEFEVTDELQGTFKKWFQ